MPDPKRVVARFTRTAMSNLVPKRTGVDATIWISHGQYAGVKSQHAARVKVEQNHRLDCSVTISLSPKVVRGALPPALKKQVFQWVILNHDALMQFWNMEIEDPFELIELLKKI